MEISFAGCTFQLENVNDMDLVARQIASGSYEPPLPMLMMATLIRSEGIFIDVGANTGVYTVMAGTIVRDRPIIAFEPFHPVLEILRRNLALNGLTDRVRLMEVALSDKAGTAKLHLPDPGHGLVETSASLEPDFQPAKSICEVPVKQLDEVSISDQIAVIKVDIEGHEHAFLRGARNTILRDRPVIFAEVVSPAKRSAIGAFLHGIDYMDFRLRPDMAIHDGEVLFDNAAWNHALIPRERLAKFKEACDACNMVMLRRFQLS
ncbi:FkbM family methyltransferase [Methylobacterium sp. Leaf125]|uniref:FkbM family methyltransferase n=1 Tax=Methylobacterium sp. Leaf125 TaxID=1736265 RepID=UPI000700D750|nr:FkbM family methyltransferase [Methylobacterium sp. Leaf125]KQQ32585.1 FkbM family methyltransferase [Methylobacterium sp. Leaf125]